LKKTCEKYKTPWFEDPTNSDPTYTRRNAIRKLTEVQRALPEALRKNGIMEMVRRANPIRNLILTRVNSLLRKCTFDEDRITGCLRVFYPLMIAKEPNIIMQHFIPALVRVFNTRKLEPFALQGSGKDKVSPSVIEQFHLMNFEGFNVQGVKFSRSKHAGYKDSVPAIFDLDVVAGTNLSESDGTSLEPYQRDSSSRTNYWGFAKFDDSFNDSYCVLLAPEESRRFTKKWDARKKFNRFRVHFTEPSTPEIRTFDGIKYKRMDCQFPQEWILPWEYEAWVRLKRDGKTREDPFDYYFAAWRMSQTKYKKLVGVLREHYVTKNLLANSEDVEAKVRPITLVRRVFDRLNRRHSDNTIFPVLWHDGINGRVMDSIPHLSLHFNENVRVFCKTDNFNIYFDDQEYHRLKWDDEDEKPKWQTEKEMENMMIKERETLISLYGSRHVLDSWKEGSSVRTATRAEETGVEARRSAVRGAVTGPPEGVRKLGYAPRGFGVRDMG
jgi:PP-loop family